MVQLIDFNRIDIIKLNENEVKIVDITIEKEGLLDLTTEQLYNEINTIVREKIAAAAVCVNDSLWIEINIKDNTIDEDDSLYFLCANIIAANMIAGKMREREPRLKVPPIIQTNGLFGYVWLKRMVNEQLWCDKIGGIVNINGDEVMIV